MLMATPLYDWFGKRTYAQSGEDVIAWGELKELKNSNKKSRNTCRARPCRLGTSKAWP